MHQPSSVTIRLGRSLLPSALTKTLAKFPLLAIGPERSSRYRAITAVRIQKLLAISLTVTGFVQRYSTPSRNGPSGVLLLILGQILHNRNAHLPEEVGRTDS